MATLTSEEFYIIIPAEATNEISYNPSFELSLLTSGGFGVSPVGGSIAHGLNSYSRRGACCLEVTPASGTQSGFYYATVNEVSGATRTFSVDVYNPTVGQAMRIGIYTTGGSMLTETTFTADGYWQRISVTRTGNSNTTRRLYVLRDAIASTAVWYADGLYYSTVDGTYLDGDMKGFVSSAIEYRWNGTAHASTSWRSGATRSGGTLLRIKDYAKIKFPQGLGMAPVTNVAAPLSTDRSSFQSTEVVDPASGPA